MRQVAALEEEAQQVAVQGATERNVLQSKLADVEAEFATVVSARRAAEVEMAEASKTIGELIHEGASLSHQVAELETETEKLTADIAARELRLKESHTMLARAEQRATELVTERETLAAAVSRGD